MNRFYVLKVGRFTQYKYAWYEPFGRDNYADDWPRCPACDRAVGMRYWLPPHRVVLKQPRNVGDFVSGPGGPDLLVSERFRADYVAEGLTGIRDMFPVEVARMGTTAKARTLAMPQLYGVYFTHASTR